MSCRCSQDAEDSISDLSLQGTGSSPCASGTPPAVPFSGSIGLVSVVLTTYATSPEVVLKPHWTTAEVVLISSAADSLASPSATPAFVKPKLTIGGSGLKWPESFAYYDPDTSLLRTCQDSLLPDSSMCSVTLPKRGSMRSGSLYELPTSGHLTAESECSSSQLLPTPSASGDARNTGTTSDYFTLAGELSRLRASGDPTSPLSDAGNPSMEAHPTPPMSEDA